MAVVGGVTEVTYNTPLPFINLTVAEIVGPALVLQGQSRNVQFAAQEAFRTGDSAAATARATAAEALLDDHRGPDRRRPGRAQPAVQRPQLLGHGCRPSRRIRHGPPHGDGLQ